MTTALALKSDPTAFEPDSPDGLLAAARMILASGLAPRSLKSVEAVAVVLWAGRELGFSAMQSLRGIHVVEGRPTLSADAILALCVRSPVCEFFQLVESTDQRAEYVTKRRGAPEPVPLAYTMKEAQTAQLTGKDNWRKYPPAMLRARCIAALARIVYPDLVLGIYTPDEMGDDGPPPTPTARVVPRARTVAPALAGVPAPEPPSEPAPDQSGEYVDAGPSEGDLRAVVGAALKRGVLIGPLTDTLSDALGYAVKNAADVKAEDRERAIGIVEGVAEAA